MSLTDPSLQILFEDDHLIAVIKPPGMLAQGDASRSPSLLTAVRRHWSQQGPTDPAPFVGLVHRLDRNVSGVMVLAKTAKAAARLSDQIRRQRVRKFYLCQVEGQMPEETGELVHYLRKEKSLKATVFPRETQGAKRASLTYRVLKNEGETSLLEIELHTGRFHQIRAQLAFIKHPIVGDVKYRASRTLPENRLALFAHRLELAHPVTGKTLVLEARPDFDWLME